MEVRENCAPPGTQDAQQRQLAISKTVTPRSALRAAAAAPADPPAPMIATGTTLERGPKAVVTDPA